jgi:hypothetical protein
MRAPKNVEVGHDLRFFKISGTYEPMTLRGCRGGSLMWRS